MDVKMNGNMWMIACHGYLPDHINNADTEFVNRFANILSFGAPPMQVAMVRPHMRHILEFMGSTWNNRKKIFNLEIDSRTIPGVHQPTDAPYVFPMYHTVPNILLQNDNRESNHSYMQIYRSIGSETDPIHPTTLNGIGNFNSYLQEWTMAQESEGLPYLFRPGLNTAVPDTTRLTNRSIRWRKSVTLEELLEDLSSERRPVSERLKGSGEDADIIILISCAAIETIPRSVWDLSKELNIIGPTSQLIERISTDKEIMKFIHSSIMHYQLYRQNGIDNWRGMVADYLVDYPYGYVLGNGMITTHMDNGIKIKISDFNKTKKILHTDVHKVPVQETIIVSCPDDAVPGDEIIVTNPDGLDIGTVVLPEGVQPGELFNAPYPGPPPQRVQLENILLNISKIYPFLGTSILQQSQIGEQYRFNDFSLIPQEDIVMRLQQEKMTAEQELIGNEHELYTLHNEEHIIIVTERIKELKKFIKEKDYELSLLQAQSAMVYDVHGRSDDQVVTSLPLIPVDNEDIEEEYQDPNRTDIADNRISDYDQSASDGRQYREPILFTPDTREPPREPSVYDPFDDFHLRGGNKKFKKSKKSKFKKSKFKKSKKSKFKKSKFKKSKKKIENKY
jgi:hypothetical protein